MSNSAVACLPVRVKICQLTASTLGKEIGDIENASVQHNPDISFLGLLINFNVWPLDSFFCFLPGALDAAFIVSSDDPPANLGHLHVPREAPERSANDVAFTLSPNIYFARAAPAQRPKTTHPKRESFPPIGCCRAPPATSPPAYRPRIACDPDPKTAESSSISKPPMPQRMNGVDNCNMIELCCEVGSRNEVVAQLLS